MEMYSRYEVVERGVVWRCTVEMYRRYEVVERGVVWRCTVRMRWWREGLCGDV